MALWKSLLVQQFGIFVYLFAVLDAQSLDKMPPVPLCPDPYTVYRLKRTCYNNCDNMKSTTEVCVKPYIYGCDCIDGYVFQSATSNVCVPVSNCKILCPPNMHFDPCITTYRLTCATRNNKPVPTGGCLPRCVCNTGYILSNDPIPVCVKIIKCLAIPELPADSAVLKI